MPGRSVRAAAITDRSGTEIVEQPAVDARTTAADVLTAATHADQVDDAAVVSARQIARVVAPATASPGGLASPADGTAGGVRPAGDGPMSTVTAPGTITYIWGNDVWITDSRGSSPIRVTTNGSTATGDGTGNTNYFAPTQSADGSTIVAARNQDDSGAQTGWLWVMDRTGKVIRKIKPLQYQLQPLPDKRCVGATYATFPMGLGNARVSPDGLRVIYQQTVGMVSPYPSCTAVTGVFSFVTATDGSSAAPVARAGNNDASFLSIGGWVSNTRVLTTDMLFGTGGTYYSDMPSTAAKLWYSDGEMLDLAYHDPQIANGHMATVGTSAYSQNANANLFDVVRFWNSAGPTAAPAMQCEYRATHGIRTDLGPPSPMPTALRPALSPDGLAAVWQDSYGMPDTAGEGVWIVQLPAGSLSGASCAAAAQYLLTAAWDPSWSAAPLTLPTTAAFTVAPATRGTTGQTVTLTATIGGGKGRPSGSITFYDGADALTSVSLDQHGTAVLSLPTIGVGALSVGSHSFRASYAGDLGHASANMGPEAFTVDFSDVLPGAQFYDDITWLIGNGITQGYADGTFGPRLRVTRQSMAAFLYRMANGPATPAPCVTQQFWDVPATATFCPHIAWLAAQGITQGYVDTGHALPGFHPTAMVTRQSMAAFLYRMANGPATPAPCVTQQFWDVPTASLFCPEISWLAAEGITQGYSDGRALPGYHPTDPVTRQSMAAFLHRYSDTVSSPA